VHNHLIILVETKCQLNLYFVFKDFAFDLIAVRVKDINLVLAVIIGLNYLKDVSLISNKFLFVFIDFNLLIEEKSLGKTDGDSRDFC
jgi:hypothetical protein